MKSKAELNTPTDRHYTKEHIWVKKDGDALVAGISDFAQDELGDIVYVDIAQSDGHLNAGDEFGSVESVKSVNSLFMPVAGTIAAVNENLADAPEGVNASCYDTGWIIRIKPDNMADADALLSASEYVGTLD